MIEQCLTKLPDLDETTRLIITHEWEMFQAVNNEGGRAACQENPSEFALMRAAQCITWSPKIRQSWLDDLVQAATGNRNLMTEKYARMMSSTYPDEYALIADALPPLSDTCLAYIEELVAITVQWAEETAQRYPAIAARGRPIHKSADTYQTTSIETYAFAEYATYSQHTLECMVQWLHEKNDEGVNLQLVADEWLARCKGYENLQAANRATLKKR
ncbi:MAG: DUF4125 family protein [Coriobacteriia bacterium]|nr:DUF4125 family protein [Coriobacteriia bacterium]